MPAFIYLVVGDTGAYSDHTQWNVGAYTTREMAELHHTRLLDALKSYEDTDWDEREQAGNTIRAELDSSFVGYGEAHYNVVEMPLFRHLDEFLESL